jgi:Flp pilus assembly protein protease CpaA
MSGILLPSVGTALLVMWLAGCVVSDLRSRNVPWWLRLPPLFAAMVCSALEGAWRAPLLVFLLIPASALPRRWLAPLSLFLALLLSVKAPAGEIWVLAAVVWIWLMWMFGLMGGADAQIMVTVVILIGNASVIVAITLAGGALGVLGGLRKKATVPYVLAIAMGTLAYMAGSWMQGEGVTMKRFLSDSRALESTEVALLIAAVVLVAYAAYRVLGERIAAVVMDIAGKF